MKIIDLTMNVDETTPLFPGSPKIIIEQCSRIETDGSNMKTITINSHFGTHIDAPYHQFEDGKKLDEYPVEKLIGEAIVVDVSGQKDIQPVLDDVKEDDILLLYTGRSENPNPETYFKDNPVIGKEVTKKLVEKKIRILGMDTFTPDNEPYTMHKILFKEDILIVENLVNLKELVGKRFECIILPLKLTGADGSPCRVIARLNNQ